MRVINLNNNYNYTDSDSDNDNDNDNMIITPCPSNGVMWSPFLAHFL